MVLLQDMIGQQLRWDRLGLFSGDYELRANNQIFGRLIRQGVWRRYSIGEVDGQQWTFKREGFWRNKMVVYPGGEGMVEGGQELASLTRKMGGDGVLTFQDGHSYIWTHTGIIQRVWSWKSEDGTTILNYTKNKNLEVVSPASSGSDLALLVAFGFFLIVVMREDAAAAAAASA